MKGLQDLNIIGIECDIAHSAALTAEGSQKIYKLKKKSNEKSFFSQSKTTKVEYFTGAGPLIATQRTE